MKKKIIFDDALMKLSERIRKVYLVEDRPLKQLLSSGLFNAKLPQISGFRKLMFSTLFLVFFISKAVAPDSNTITLFEPPVIRPFFNLMYAIGMVETMGNILAYNEFENAVGIFQIRQVRIDDYNRRTGSKYSLSDMFDPQLSEKVFLYFASLCNPYDLEKIAKAWNGSGPKTEYYWKRIKEYL